MTAGITCIRATRDIRRWARRSTCRYSNKVDMTKLTTSRRTFVQMAAAGLSLAASSRGRADAAPSDRIQVGFIGLGGQGTGRLRQFMKQSDVAAVAVCDVDQTHLDRAVALVEKEQGRKPEAFHDFRKLLEIK